LNTVLHAIDTTGPGGAETVCVELAAGLDRSRYRSCSAVTGPGWVYDTLRARELDPMIVRTGRGPVDFAYLYRLMAVARRKRASLIQTHLLGANLYGSLAARLLRVPAVATFHGMVDVAPSDRRARVKLRAITANVSRLVFVSEALRHHFLHTYAVSDRRTVVVANGIDPEHYRRAPHRGLRTELGIPDEAVLIGAVGNIRPSKGYDALLRIADRLRGHRPEILFVVAGEPSHPLLERLLALRRELRLEDRVTFLGFRSDVAEVLNGVDIYLSTSTSEGFSLTTLQAMACGLPVIATRSGGPEEIITDGQDGLLAPVGVAGGIATTIERLAASVARRREIGEAGRKTVIARFTLRRMVSAYEAIYDEALDASRPSGVGVRRRV
jgi:glycosyltransferase involved in cell wall biosynthesis